MRSNLISFRKNLGMTQSQMAEMFNMSLGNWCSIEKGRITGTATMWVSFGAKFYLDAKQLQKLMEVSE